MRVRLTQIIDFWIGVPLCLFFSLIHFLISLILPPKKVLPKRILFVEISEMGSAIIAYSSLMRAKNVFHTEHLYFLVFEKNRESVELLGLIPSDHVIGIADSSFMEFALSTFKALLKIRSLNVDTVIDLELFSRFTALFSYASRASNRVGFNNYTAEGLFRGTFLTHRVFYNPHQHMAFNFLALVEALSAPEKEFPLLKKNVRDSFVELPRYPVTREQKENIFSMLKEVNPKMPDRSRLVVFNPDPGDALPIRGWPLPHFVEAAKDLLESDASLVVVIIGLKRFQSYAQAFIEQLPAERVCDLTGKTKTLSEVVALFAISDLLIGNDSGPAHFAALTDIPIVTLFGPETPALYGPLSRLATNLFSGYSCSPCLSAANHRHTCCRDNKCLQVILPKDVVHTAKDALVAIKRNRSRLRMEAFSQSAVGYDFAGQETSMAKNSHDSVESCANHNHLIGQQNRGLCRE